MKPIVLLTGAIVIFGAGLVAGHYHRSADKTARVERSTSTVTTAPSQIGFPGSRASRSAGNARSPTQIQQNPENGASLPSPALPPHERVFSIEEQAQWEAQQLEARQAELAQLDAMIQSMESAGLPEEQIKHFRELKEGRAKAPIPELHQAWNPSLPERTPEELQADFAASLEQTGIPEAQRKAMLEAFSQQFEPTDGNLPDSFSAALPPPHEPQN